ncbi:MAG: ferric reductase-like transmembrane domain-containing protein [Actinomycetota bacterium]
MNPKLWWYVARSCGIVAWGLLTLSVLWGLFVSTRLLGKKAPPAWLLDLHRFLGSLSVTFVGLHLVGLWADTYVHFGPSQLFLPFVSRWKPGAVAWGVVGFYVLIAIELTSLAMKRIPRRVWKNVHRTSFVLYAVATVHALTAGTDAKVLRPAALMSALIATLLIFFMWSVRVLSPRGSGRKREHVPRPVATRPRADTAVPG